MENSKVNAGKKINQISKKKSEQIPQLLERDLNTKQMRNIE